MWCAREPRAACGCFRTSIARIVRACTVLAKCMQSESAVAPAPPQSPRYQSVLSPLGYGIKYRLLKFAVAPWRPPPAKPVLQC
jgi:hypothetical protein